MLRANLRRGGVAELLDLLSLVFSRANAAQRRSQSQLLAERVQLQGTGPWPEELPTPENVDLFLSIDHAVTVHRNIDAR